MILEHLDKQTADGTVQNLDALYQLFPSCFTEKEGVEGKVKRAINWGKLRELLGENVADGEPEVYDFTWVGKRAAQREAMAPCRKTLRPCPEESVNWDTTQNLYIEGDNLEVLKLLQNSYMGKIDIIYIDPPYNTGSDFVYQDDFHRSQKDEDEAAGVINENGERLIKNTESNGKFHSDWCSMLYSRLMVARNLLAKKGVIFISIDDNEIINLKKICDEVFGESSYVSSLIIESSVIAGPRRVPAMQGSVVKTSEYCLVYSRDGDNQIMKNLKYDFIEGFDSHYCNYLDENNKRIISLTDLISNTPSILKRFQFYNLRPNYVNLGNLISIDSTIRDWLYSDTVASSIYRKGGKEKLDSDCYPMYQLFKVGSKWYIKTEEGTFNVFRYIDRIGACDDYFQHYGERQVRGNLWKGFSSDGGNLDKEGSISFKNGKKPIRLIKQLLHSVCDKDDALIMDFFSGSATTAHAIMQINSEDGGHRKFILVQIQEETEENSEPYKAGFVNICEIGKERIRRSGKKIKEDNPLTTQDLDIGFRVFKCDESNYKDVAFAPKDYSQESLELFVDNIKEDRSDLDLLFDCMLRWGITLDLPMTSTKVDGCKIHNVNEGALVACFEGRVTEKVIDAICAMEPNKVVFRDSSFEEAAQKMNLFELFKQKLGWEEQEVRNNIRVI